ncbi:MAG: 16S rRNA (cytidine(1402)-2'-O)-methyltransferase [Oscillospiraceae bacterium]|jgi:16S rRNA (cytidine1402-2'-O)-methyltransferase|nr:16S rRNA (cytidine(1402)-2'-O)-methyltransferase [Oscillospiraceae bacterium]
MEIRKGVLYVTGTPIGNLGDLSPRALETLGGVDFIAAEDTRVSLKLLTKFGIKKPMLACRRHNIREVSGEIVRRLQGGESCAVITDAGMPCISDPGAELVGLCRERGVETEVVPGPSALVAALALSGFACRRFSFEGFLSVNPRQRKERLDKIKDYDGLIVLYEAPHKLNKTLADLLSALGDREIAVCREMTKIHEEVLRGCLSEVSVHFENTAPRGEFVIVIEPLTGGSPPVNPADAAKIAQDLVTQGHKPAEACKLAAKQTKLSKSEIYKEYLKI